MKLTMLLALSAAASALAACSTVNCGNPHPYTGARARPPLQAPPGLTVPSPDPAYALAATAPPAPGQRTDINAAGTCLIAPPQVVTPPKPASSGNPTPVPEAGKPAAKPAPAPASTTSVKPAGVAAPPPLG